MPEAKWLVSVFSASKCRCRNSSECQTAQEERGRWNCHKEPIPKVFFCSAAIMTWQNAPEELEGSCLTRLVRTLLVLTELPGNGLRGKSVQRDFGPSVTDEGWTLNRRLHGLPCLHGHPPGLPSLPDGVNSFNTNTLFHVNPFMNHFVRFWSLLTPWAEERSKVKMQPWRLRNKLRSQFLTSCILFNDYSIFEGFSPLERNKVKYCTAKKDIKHTEAHMRSFSPLIQK